jgi:hypothetical protein
VTTQLSEDRIVYVKPLARSTPLHMSLTNGFGSSLGSYSRPDERGCYFATHWIRFFFFPVIPIRRYYMTGHPSHGKLLGQAPLDAGEVLKTYAFAWLFCPAFILVPFALLKAGSVAWAWLLVSAVLIVVLIRSWRRRWAPRYVAQWGQPDPQPHQIPKTQAH